MFPELPDDGQGAHKGGSGESCCDKNNIGNYCLKDNKPYCGECSDGQTAECLLRQNLHVYSVHTVRRCARDIMFGHPLRPHMIMRKLAMADIENKAEILQDFDIRQAAICSECGICEVYACSMGLKPRQMNIMLKGMLRDAGIRYERAQDSYEAHPNRDNTKAPTKRTAARAGVLAYYDISIKNCKECVPDTVRIPMSMHIGAPSEMIVTEGEKVHKGQLIGRCPEGSLGANIHASISGTVHIDENTVIIMG